jgi:hypothetical protein
LINDDAPIAFTSLAIAICHRSGDGGFFGGEGGRIEEAVFGGGFAFAEAGFEFGQFGFFAVGQLEDGLGELLAGGYDLLAFGEGTLAGIEFSRAGVRRGSDRRRSGRGGEI